MHRNNTLLYRLAFVFVFILVIVAEGSAQKLRVDRFILDRTDASAQARPRYDLNEELCALVKVEVASSKAEFDGDIVAPAPEYKMGQYWVYMPAGATYMLIHVDGYLTQTVDFTKYQAIGKLQAGNTYLLTIEMPGAHPYAIQNNITQPAQPQPSKPQNTVSNNIEVFNVNGVSFEMVRVDGGSFMMGSNDGDPDEKPVHSETVGTYYIGKTEVTQRLWTAVMGNNPSRFKGDNLPVEQVSWDDCMEFVDRLSRLTGRTFRLPTEAEWEYAARGGNKSRGYEYSGSNDVDRVAWYGENSGNQTHPVAQKLDNELGIYDMSGNVWEWVADKWCGNYSQPRNSSDRVNRGGSVGNFAVYCRSANRTYYPPSIRSNRLGFRLAL